jgi:hypothetical protein
MKEMASELCICSFIVFDCVQQVITKIACFIHSLLSLFHFPFPFHTFPFISISVFYFIGSFILTYQFESNGNIIDLYFEV